MRNNNSRHLTVFVTLLMILLLSTTVLAFNPSVSFTARHLSLGESLLLGALGYAFDLDTDVVLRYRSDAGTTEGAVTVTYASGQTGVSADEILKARKRGRTWEEIVPQKPLPPGLQKKPSTHPGRANHEAKRRHGVDPYEFDTTIEFLADYYAVRADWVIGWLEAGITLDDIALSLNLAARVHIRPDEVLRLRYNSVEWEWVWIASRYGITIELLEEPVPPKGVFPAPGRGFLR